MRLITMRRLGLPRGPVEFWGGRFVEPSARYRVTFLPHNVTVEVDGADSRYGGHGAPGSLLDIALRHGIDLRHDCGGRCACTTCHVVVREGDGNLSPIGREEEDRLDMARGLTRGSRLGCQAVARGDVVVELLE